MTVPVGSPWTLPLASEAAALDLVGGKGASLMRLATSGFPVPPGFLITTAAYRCFVAENGLQAVIDDALRGVDGSDPASFERAAATIQDAFARGMVPQEIVAAIQQAYAALGEPEPAVAARSSATAEDLPGLSFAGQQETFLDVSGQTALLDAIRRAWRRSGRRGRSPTAGRWVSVTRGLPWPWLSRSWCRPRFPVCSSRRTRQLGIAASS